MRLLASGSEGDNSGLIGALFVLGVIAYVVYHVYIFFARPDQWAEMQRRKHEKEMASAEEARPRRAGSPAASWVPLPRHGWAGSSSTGTDPASTPNFATEGTGPTERAFFGTP